MQHVDMTASTYKASFPLVRARNFKLRLLLAWCEQACISISSYRCMCVCVCEQEYRFWKFVLLPCACMHAFVPFRGDCVMSSYHTAACNIISSFFTGKNGGKPTTKQDIRDGVDSQYSINVQRPTGIESDQRMPPYGSLCCQRLPPQK